MNDEIREAKAKSLLEDDLLKEAFDTLEKDIMDTWVASSDFNPIPQRAWVYLANRLSG